MRGLVMMESGSRMGAYVVSVRSISVPSFVHLL